MKLTNKGRYAVMAMADLAANAKGGPISLSEISLRQNISLAYLEQIFLKLKNSGLVKSSRGSNGGYVLDRPASEIRLSSIIFLPNFNEILSSFKIDLFSLKDFILNFFILDIDNEFLF